MVGGENRPVDVRGWITSPRDRGGKGPSSMLGRALLTLWSEGKVLVSVLFSGTDCGKEFVCWRVGEFTLSGTVFKVGWWLGWSTLPGVASELGSSLLLGLC